jgi:hypothetical protein
MPARSGVHVAEILTAQFSSPGPKRLPTVMEPSEQEVVRLGGKVNTHGGKHTSEREMFHTPAGAKAAAEATAAASIVVRRTPIANDGVGEWRPLVLGV